MRYLKDMVRDPLGNAGRVRGYRGGYLPTQRREIERELRAGNILTVVSTNALELGIDIGQLDACVLCGYPGTIASTWQQAGRAGRRGSKSLMILVASSGPLDQYIVNHPDYFFGQSPELSLIHIFMAGEAQTQDGVDQAHTAQPQFRILRCQIPLIAVDLLVDVFDFFRRYAAAVVAHFDAPAAVRASKAHQYAPRGPGVFEAVLEDVYKRQRWRCSTSIPT